MMFAMPEFDAVLFADLHLSPKKPRIDELFDAFCARVAGTPEIACLGDLTEYWIGFPQLKDPHGKHVYDQLARLAKGAKRCVYVGGNRDFIFDNLRIGDSAADVFSVPEPRGGLLVLFTSAILIRRSRRLI